MRSEYKVYTRSDDYLKLEYEINSKVLDFLNILKKIKFKNVILNIDNLKEVELQVTISSTFKRK